MGLGTVEMARLPLGEMVLTKAIGLFHLDNAAIPVFDGAIKAAKHLGEVRGD